MRDSGITANPQPLSELTTNRVPDASHELRFLRKPRVRRLFLDAKTAEIAQFYNARSAGINFLQLSERIVQGDQAAVLGRAQVKDIVNVESLKPSAVFIRCAFARRVHQNAAHDLRAGGEEMRSAFPVHLANINQFDVDLVDKGGRFERMSGAFPFREASGHATQFFVNARGKSIQRGRVAMGPSEKKLSGFRHFLFHDVLAHDISK